MAADWIGKVGSNRKISPYAGRFIPILAFLALEILYFLPMAWGWHSVPFHLFSPRFTGVEYHRSLPAALERMPGNDATPVIMDYPNEYYTALQLRRGRLPWWNPDVGTGRPWIGNAQVHPFSPLLLPLLIHPSPWTYTLQFLLGSLICLLGAYWLFRLMDLQALPAFLGAALWTWNPFSASVYIMSSVWAYWWMPLAAAGTLLAVRRGRSAGWLITAAALSLMVLCGQPETALVLGEMYAVLVLCMIAGKRTRSIPAGRLAAGLAVSALLAVALCAAQWVPILVVLRNSVWYKSSAGGAVSGLTHPLRDFLDPFSVVFLPPAVLALALSAFRRLRWEAVGFGLMFLFCLGFTQHGVSESLPYRLLRLDGIVPALHGAELACVPAAGLCALGLQFLLSAEGPLAGRRLKIAAAIVCLGLSGWAVYALSRGAEAGWMAAGWLAASALAFIWCLAAVSREMRTTSAALLAGLLILFPLASNQFLYPYFSGSPQPHWRAFIHMEGPA